MKNLLRRYAIVLAVLLLSGVGLRAQKLYLKTFGDKKSPAIVFLHGGPGYNSASFEIGAAEKLAARGYYVVVYDRRGTVRSKTKKEPDYDFAEANRDLLGIFSRAGIKRATLLGHSFGGLVAQRFAQAQPEMVDRIVFVSAPLSFPQTMKAILANCRKHYEEKGDLAQLAYINLLDTMDNRSLQYSSYCLGHATACGFYQPKVLSEEALQVYQQMRSHPDFAYVSKSRPQPVEGFHKSSRYTCLDFRREVRALPESIPAYGIYGLEDGLFDLEVLDGIGETIGEENLHRIAGASHSVFLDQQALFFQALDSIMRP